MKLPFKSLATRITMAAAAILTVAGLAIGYALYRQVRRSLESEVELRLRSRLETLQVALEFHRGKLEFEPRQLGEITSQRWRVATPSGKVIFESNWSENKHRLQTDTKTVILGDPKGAPVPDEAIVKTKEARDGFPVYATGDGRGKLELRLSAREPTVEARRELERLELALWTIGPLSVLALTAVFALFIRWQLSPLKRMSEEAAGIGPENAAARIGPAGTSRECVKLRESINIMVQRLAAQLERERQFASMAAHELRTPLAQMRTAIEVALRKERAPGEYREALSGSLLDLERLQKLVENLLFLARNNQGIEAGKTIPLRGMIEHAKRGSASDASVAPEVGAMSARGNEELLASALRNVLENASRYAPGSPPQINALQMDGKIDLIVSDSGPGVPGPDREKIFEPLTRLDQARSIGDAADGFGLGLTVARAAVRACGGNLFCRARADGQPGAEFVFELRPA